MPSFNQIKNILSKYDFAVQTYVHYTTELKVEKLNYYTMHHLLRIKMSTIIYGESTILSHKRKCIGLIKWDSTNVCS